MDAISSEDSFILSFGLKGLNLHDLFNEFRDIYNK